MASKQYRREYAKEYPEFQEYRKNCQDIPLDKFFDAIETKFCDVPSALVLCMVRFYIIGRAPKVVEMIYRKLRDANLLTAVRQFPTDGPYEVFMPSLGVSVNAEMLTEYFKEHHIIATCTVSPYRNKSVDAVNKAVVMFSSAADMLIVMCIPKYKAYVSDRVPITILKKAPKPVVEMNYEMWCESIKIASIDDVFRTYRQGWELTNNIISAWNAFIHMHAGEEVAMFKKFVEFSVLDEKQPFPTVKPYVIHLPHMVTSYPLVESKRVLDTFLLTCDMEGRTYVMSTVSDATKGIEVRKGIIEFARAGDLLSVLCYGRYNSPKPNFCLPVPDVPDIKLSIAASSLLTVLCGASAK